MLTPALKSTAASTLALLLALALSLSLVPSAHAEPIPAPGLSGLTVSSGSLTPGFDPAVTHYTVTVPNTTSSFSLTPTTGEPDATITVWNGDGNVTVASGQATPSSFLVVGTNIRTATVVAPGGASTQYTVSVTREAAPAPAYDPRLGALTVSTGTLSPSFSAAVENYTVDLPYVTSSLTFTATAVDSGHTVAVKNAGSGATETTMFVPLSGVVALITVTAPDDTTRVYTVHVTRGPAPTADVDLASLELSAGTLTPAFDPTVQNYTATVPYAVRSLQVTTTAAAPGNTITINNEVMVDGEPHAVSLIFDPLGNGFGIRVTAPNGVEKIYSVIVTRDQPSDNADLTGLSLSSGDLVPVFSNAQTAYQVDVPYLTTSMQVTGVLADPTAILRVNNVDTASGVPSASVMLPVGTTVIVVAATAEDGVSVTSRTIAVTRAAPDLNLASLTVTDGALSPAFDPATTGYTLEVPYLSSSIVVAASAVESGWTVAVDGAIGGTSTVGLLVGRTEVAITVTALYGETRTYAIQVVRLSAPPVAITFDVRFQAGDIAAGSELGVTATSLLPSSTATVTMHSTPVRLASGTVQSDATLTLGAHLPSTVPAGAHRIVLEGTALDGTPASATVWFTVLRNGTIGAVSLAGPVAYTEGSLAATGAETASGSAAGAVLLALGGLLVMVGASRRRRRATA